MRNRYLEKETMNFNDGTYSVDEVLRKD